MPFWPSPYKAKRLPPLASFHLSSLNGIVCHLLKGIHPASHVAGKLDYGQSATLGHVTLLYRIVGQIIHLVLIITRIDSEWSARLTRKRRV